MFASFPQLTLGALCCRSLGELSNPVCFDPDFIHGYIVLTREILFRFDHPLTWALLTCLIVGLPRNELPDRRHVAKENDGNNNRRQPDEGEKGDADVWLV